MIEKFTEDEIRIIERELMERRHVMRKSCACASAIQRLEDRIAEKYKIPRSKNKEWTWANAYRNAAMALADVATGNVQIEKKERCGDVYYEIRRNTKIDTGVKKFVEAHEKIVSCVLEIIEKGDN